MIFEALFGENSLFLGNLFLSLSYLVTLIVLIIGIYLTFKLRQLLYTLIPVGLNIAIIAYSYFVYNDVAWWQSLLYAIGIVVVLWYLVYVLLLDPKIYLTELDNSLIGLQGTIHSLDATNNLHVTENGGYKKEKVSFKNIFNSDPDLLYDNRSGVLKLDDSINGVNKVRFSVDGNYPNSKAKVGVRAYITGVEADHVIIVLLG